ncbi:MAG: response regulator transcription factor [Lachnospiraceae bacterium]|nr:response regulator transcription factor [Lachnospiraceae bacterium]
MKQVILKAGVTEAQVQFHEFLSGELLLTYLEHADAKCDLLILDMQLPGMNGDEVAESFRTRFPNTTLVFCSGVAKPTDRSFKVMAYRYLYKEYTDDKMLEEIKEIIQKMIMHKAEPVIMAHNYFRQVQLKLDEILYIQLARRGSKIHVCPNVDIKEIHGDLLCNEKLSDLYEVLKDFGFAYAHNSYIVNLKYVKKILTNELVFVKWENETHEQRLSVSRTKVKELKKIFAIELGKKYQG